MRLLCCEEEELVVVLPLSVKGGNEVCVCVCFVFCSLWCNCWGEFGVLWCVVLCLFCFLCVCIVCIMIRKYERIESLI